MKNSFYSIKVCAYVFLFSCLFNLVTGDEEGYFYLTLKDTDYSWNIAWEDTNDGKKMAEVIKSKEGNQIALTFEKLQFESNERFIYTDKVNYFNFDSFDGSEVRAAPYDIIVDVDGTSLYFTIKNEDNNIWGLKVGQLKDGEKELSKFSFALPTNANGKYEFILGYRENSNPSSDAKSDQSSEGSSDPSSDAKSDKSPIILILLILLLISTTLYFVF